ncbi:MAG: hypothetical protein UV64_C0003G0010 [Parcubacteria group bacterium GW2011_GWC1_43_11b]|uniref:LTD domain-containing protein n=2 Tax=Candidatus Vogeliibacteriota TaxID=1817922 RepID=A0A1G2QBW4_9BACT|nr:MAG: hypothetical protein UV50_C0003G0010 [Parcubacteria group bacterium GW2011_GWB1_42_9]KKS89612.1 MAG: hypothetical protein UV64_C0003G0010 [Parcubacteria group bacterium GW2011_GWC1_43_11b]KKT10063.1 MAG: hypothetical protein UV88_C0002G0010 [Parcubacteria group bacterium GW2011_GWA1_43_21]OHA58050.1 MAG: hypothetical protein A2370_01655 [Candidatus Vogelbacteria bacterium RIFOXYB1_FULL_42_16]OHA58319.1 MAG: hypothetical protein A2607_00330 [Candidatus Vogelbacteria bacterium RIFOXYD1_FU
MFTVKSDLAWVGLVMAGLFLLWLVTGGPTRIQNGPFIKPLTPVGTGESYGRLPGFSGLIPKVSTTSTRTSFISRPTVSSGSNRPSTAIKADEIETSRYHGLVTINRGNSSSEKNSSREYITLQGSSQIKESINISSWTLRNGSSERYYNISGQTVQGQSALVKIPRAVLVWQKNQPMTVVPVKIGAGYKVQVISGSFPPVGAYQIRDSFRVNKCMGYIANQAGYNSRIFYPSMSGRCPRPADEPGVSTLYNECYDYVRSLNTCHTPDFREDWCRAHAEDQARNVAVCKLPTSCKDFVRARYNYEACLALHRQDEDFLLPEWRVYLGSIWELWADRRESITLYDQFGEIVDQVKY